MDDREKAATPGQAKENEGAKLGTVAPTLADGEEHPVDPLTVRVARIASFLVILPIAMIQLIFLTIGWATGGMAPPLYLGILGVWLMLFAPVFLLTYRWPAARYRHLRYQVEEDGLRIRRGVFWRKAIWVPITRVQHTDVAQGPLQRRYDLGTLTVHTAGTAGAAISLDGLEHGIASRLSDHLRPAPATYAN